jgi:peptidoglycan/LPS O-acetylase OafA/YrhL
VVRALAILFVLVSHYGTYFTAWCGVGFPFQLAAAGFFGVELFFVLSGFLIGRLLIDILDNGASPRAWLVFMVRRWMRTLPLYYVCVATLALTWSPQFWQPHHRQLWQDLPWFLTLTQNLAWPVVDNWFGVSWSLTIEEWFYLVFSGLLFAAAMLAGRRVAFWGTVLLFILVPAMLRWRLPDSVNWDEVTSKVVIYRLDAIAFGVVVAWMQVRRVAAARYPRLLLAAGLLIILLFWGGALDRLLQPPAHLRKTFMFDVASFGFALWLPAAAAVHWHPHRWLAATAQAFSRQSYAMYLTHLTLIEMVNFYRASLHLSAPFAIIATTAGVYCLSYLSFRFLERPILALRPSQ